MSVMQIFEMFDDIFAPPGFQWVHPSWRDLVIEYLVGNAAERAHFLEHMSIHGILLAISGGGGAEGTREFPLLVDAKDWSLLAEVCARVAGEVTEYGLRKLLTSLREAGNR